MARVAIIGVGAIGGVVAALLQQAGHEVVLCTRRQLTGLVVETPGGAIDIHAANYNDPGAPSAVDWVLVATKAYDVAGAAQWLPKLCAGGAPVAVLQNGVEHRERFAPYLPAESILPVIVDCPAERVSPTLVRQRGAMHLKAPQGVLGEGFVALFAGTGTDALTTPDFLTAAWRKLCFNSAGILPALLLQPAGVFRDKKIGLAALDIIHECIAVGRAEGAVLEPEIAEAVLAGYRASPPDSVNSLHADRLAGRPMEIDARNGVILRLGERHGIPTPANRMAVALLEALLAAPIP